MDIPGESPFFSLGDRKSSRPQKKCFLAHTADSPLFFAPCEDGENQSLSLHWSTFPSRKTWQLKKAQRTKVSPLLFPRFGQTAPINKVPLSFLLSFCFFSLEILRRYSPLSLTETFITTNHPLRSQRAFWFLSPGLLVFFTLSREFKLPLQKFVYVRANL